MPRIVSTYKEEARRKVLETSLEVFKEKGFFKCTMDDIAKKLGISKGAIYQYFDSKEQLLEALYESGPENFRSLASSSSRGKRLLVEVPVPGVHGLELAAVYADELCSEEVKRPAEVDELLEDWLDAVDVVLPKVCYRLDPMTSTNEEAYSAQGHEHRHAVRWS